MARRDMPPTSSKALLDADVDYADDELPIRAPLRFGRLVLWVASASALAAGVAGTVAYRAWFSHDQREYVEAMTSARETLGLSQAAAAQQTLSSGTVDTSPPPTHPVELASADTAPPNPPEALVAAPPSAPPVVAAVPNRSPAATAKPPAAANRVVAVEPSAGSDSGRRAEPPPFDAAREASQPKSFRPHGLVFSPRELSTECQRKPARRILPSVTGVARRGRFRRVRGGREAGPDRRRWRAHRSSAC